MDAKYSLKAAKLSIICVLAHALSFGILHLLEPQLRPSSSIISDYTQTGSAWLATLTFLFFATVWASISVALVKVLKSKLISAGRILFVLASISILLGTVFPASMDPRTGSLLSKIINLLARPGLFLAVLLVSVGLMGKPDWKRQAPILLTLSISAFILLVLTINILLPRELGGIGQRLIFILLYLWVWMLAGRVLKLAGAADKSA